MSNTLFTSLFIGLLALGLLTQAFLVARHSANIRRHRSVVPDAFRDQIPLAAHQKAADYTVARVRLGMVDLCVNSLLILVWTLGGLLDLLDQAWRSAGLGTLLTGTGLMASFIAANALLEMPVSIYRTFCLEQKFGFNKTTWKLFLMDMAKQALLFAGIGLPLIIVVLWIMSAAGSLWWIYVWLTWLGFNLLMMWAYPAFIAPLFNKFRPLEDAGLRQRIEDLLARNGFTSQGIFVMDGSPRSTHGNAYFTGLGANKRIVFFDTLMSELTPPEIEAVLAHELGHFKCHHIGKRILSMALLVFAGMALLGWLIGADWFYQGLGVTVPSTYMALTLFMLIAPVFTFFLQPLFSWLSRLHEFEADEFAAQQAQSDNLVQALVKLYRENANTLTPDPLYSAFHDSHPPAPVRIAHLHGRPG